MMTPADLKAARARLGLTQRALGERLGGYCDITICRWERGKRRTIPKAVIVLIEQMLKEHDAGA